MRSEKFSSYLNRVMKQKGLNARDIERNSGKRMDSSHVSKFLRGVETNPSANAMKALAAGLGVNPHEVFAAVTGCSPDGGDTSLPDVMEMLAMMQKVAGDPVLMETLRGLTEISEEGLAAVLDLMEFYYKQNRQAQPHKLNKI